MAYIEEKCPSCGGPLPAASFDWLTCKFCGAELRAAPGAQYHIPPKLDEPPYEPDLPRIDVIGTKYVLLGKLAKGASSDVFLGRRDARITETVVIKIAQSEAQNDRLAREWKNVEQIDDPKRQGAEHFARLLPQRVLHGKVTGTERLASVFRYRAGFQYTLEHAREEYPMGVDPRAAVWMWKRVLDQIVWLSHGGFSHGALHPSHLVFHPRDHGVIFVGWSDAGASGADDVAASARAIAYVLGGDAKALPSSVPAPISDLVLEQAKGTSMGALNVKERLDEAAQKAFGPPRYHRFTMSGFG